MQGNWPFRLPSLLNMGRLACNDRFKCVCVCPLMTSELINNFNVFMVSSQLFYVTLLTALLLKLLSDSRVVQVLTRLMLDTTWSEKKSCINICLIINYYIVTSTFHFSRFFMVWAVWTSFRLTPTSGKSYTLVCHTHFGPQAWAVMSLDLIPLDWFLLGHMKDIHCCQQSHTRELMQQIMESADCIKQSDEIIRRQ